MDTLGKLFGNINKVKIMRLFLFNPDALFDLKQVVAMTKISGPVAKREIALLENINFIKEKIVYKKEKDDIKVRSKSWGINPIFPFLSQMKSILSHEVTEERGDMSKRFKNSGKIKLMLLSGFFLSNADSRIDLLIVGDSLKKSAMEREIRKMETEMGRELNYAIMETNDFSYRFYSGDRFIRDIFDYPYECLVDKIGL